MKTTRSAFARLCLLLAMLLPISAAPSYAADPPALPLTVTVTGSGTVTDGGSLACTGTCTQSYAETPSEHCIFPIGHDPICTTVYSPSSAGLRATPVAGWTFAGWSGDCQGIGACTLLMDTSRSVGALFTNSAPTVHLRTLPAILSGRASITADASDNAAVTRVDFLLGEQTIGQRTSAPYTLDWDSSTVPDGTYALRAIAYDQTNLHAENDASVTVDNTAPTLTITAGPDGQTFAPGSLQSWSFVATDAGSGVASVQCRVDSAPLGACTTPMSEVVSGVPGGTHMFTVRATDRMGHTADATRGYTIDATPPRTTITAGPNNGSSTTDARVTFAFSSSESGSTFQCRVYPAALTAPSFGACSDAGAHTALGFSPGTYTFDVRAIDAVGNVEPMPASRTFTIVGPKGDPGATGPATGGHAAVTRQKSKLPRRRHLPTRLLLLRVANFWQLHGAMTELTQLDVDSAPAHTRVDVTCAGPGRACPYKRRRYTAHGKRLRLVAPFEGRALPPDTRLNLHLDIPGFGAYDVHFTTRVAKYPLRVDLCQSSHHKKLTQCA